MDPTACAQRIIDALTNGQPEDADELMESCAELSAWLMTAGFMPDPTKLRWPEQKPA